MSLYMSLVELPCMGPHTIVEVEPSGHYILQEQAWLSGGKVVGKTSGPHAERCEWVQVQLHALASGRAPRSYTQGGPDH